MASVLQRRLQAGAGVVLVQRLALDAQQPVVDVARHQLRLQRQLAGERRHQLGRRHVECRIPHRRLRRHDRLPAPSGDFGGRALLVERHKARARLEELIARAEVVPKRRRPTKATYASKQRRLAEKSQRSEAKKRRGRPA